MKRYLVLPNPIANEFYAENAYLTKKATDTRDEITEMRCLVLKRVD